MTYTAKFEKLELKIQGKSNIDDAIYDELNEELANLREEELEVRNQMEISN